MSNEEKSTPNQLLADEQGEVKVNVQVDYACLDANDNFTEFYEDLDEAMRCVKHNLLFEKIGEMSATISLQLVKWRKVTA